MVLTNIFGVAHRPLVLDQPPDVDVNEVPHQRFDLLLALGELMLAMQQPGDAIERMARGIRPGWTARGWQTRTRFRAPATREGGGACRPLRRASLD
jgi:hypothetical protein